MGRARTMLRSVLSTLTTRYKCFTQPPCVRSIEAFARAIHRRRACAQASTPAAFVGPWPFTAVERGAVCRWKNKLRTLFAALGPYIVEGSGGPFLSRMVSASVGCCSGFLNSAAVGVDILSHQKKAVFWRELVELFPNVIDYLCNPNVDPVCYS